MPGSQQATEQLAAEVARLRAALETLTAEVTRITPRVRELEKLCEPAGDEWGL